MTLARWLRQHEEGTPPALFTRMTELAAALGDVPDDVPAACLAAAERALAELLRQDASRRESALDLLAIDALVTYALEAATEDPATVPAVAEAALTRLAALAPPA